MGEMHGRDEELAVIERLTRNARIGRGAALVVRGHAGIGKSMLLVAAREQAEAAGMAVLATNGAEAEAALPFAGLHQLLAPWLAVRVAPDRQFTPDAVLGAKTAGELFIAGGADHIVPPSVNKSNANHYRAPGTITDYHEFPGRTHWTCGEPGWEQVADYALDWALRHTS
jgi:pimeloyl-ACP methyl ester carboxylesterase